MIKSFLLFLPFLAYSQIAEQFHPPKAACCLTGSAQSLADQLQDWNQLGRYHDDNTKLKAEPVPAGRVVFLGDSITDGWKLATYFPGKPYVNRGISGQTTPQMLVRMFPDVINLKPKAMILLAGTNDIAGNTGSATFQQITENIQAISELAAHNIDTTVTPELAAAMKDVRKTVNTAERTLAAIWASLLRLPEIGANANFFELGGHSLLATQLASRVRSLLNVDLPLRQYFSTPTLDALAALIDQAAPAREADRQAIPRARRELYRVRVNGAGEFVLPASPTALLNERDAGGGVADATPDARGRATVAEAAAVDRD